MDRKLLELFNANYPNEKELFELGKKEGLKLIRKQISDFYKAQPVNQLFKRPPTKYLQIRCPTNMVGCTQVDLMQIDKFSRQNSGYKYILCAVDIYSRYAWAYPIKNKDAKSVVDPIKFIVHEIQTQWPDNWITFTMDRGNEFLGDVKRFLEEENIRIFYNDPNSPTAKTHMSIVESFNKTMWTYIRKFTTINNTLKFFDQIPKFIKNYNNRIHSTVKNKPVDIFEGRKRSLQEIDDVVSVIEVNDYVRTLQKSKAFEKKTFTPKWSEQVYQVVSKNGNRYNLVNVKTNQPLQRGFLERELQKITINKEQENSPNVQQEVKATENKNKFVRLQRKEDLTIPVNKETGVYEIPQKQQPKVTTQLRKRNNNQSNYLNLKNRRN